MEERRRRLETGLRRSIAADYNGHRLCLMERYRRLRAVGGSFAAEGLEVRMAGPLFGISIRGTGSKWYV